MGYALERRTAVAAVRLASRLTRQVQRRLDAAATLTKADTSPVTVADFGSQAIVVRALRAALPADPVVGEEAGAALRDPGNAALLARVVAELAAVGTPLAAADVIAALDDGRPTVERPARYWSVDPIDGTLGFVRGEHYAIALALVEDGQPVLGVVGCPTLPLSGGARPDEVGCLLVAERGAGCFECDLGAGPERRVRVSDRTESAGAAWCEAVEPRHSDHERAARVAAALGWTRPPRLADGQVKYALVARGEVDAYLRVPRDPARVERTWDFAAGTLVVAEAGGRATDLAGQEFVYRSPYAIEGMLGGVVATNGRLHDAVLRVLRQVP